MTHKYQHQQGKSAFSDISLLLKCITHYLGSHPLLSLKIQEALMKVNRYHFFYIEEFNDTSVLHVRCHFAQHSTCYLYQVKKDFMCYWQKCSTSTTISPTSAANIMSQPIGTRGDYFQSDSCVGMHKQMIKILKIY